MDFKMSTDFKLRIYETRPQAISYEKLKNNAGWDLFPALDSTESILIPALTSALIPIGIKTEFANDIVALIRERGSTGLVNLKVNAGVIDSNYRGEWFVCVYNANKDKDVVVTGEPEWRRNEYSADGHIVWPTYKAIAQAVFTFALHPKITRTFNLTPTSRGEGKLGSTDKI